MKEGIIEEVKITIMTYTGLLYTRMEYLGGEVVWSSERGVVKSEGLVWNALEERYSEVRNAS